MSAACGVVRILRVWTMFFDILSFVVGSAIMVLVLFFSEKFCALVHISNCVKLCKVLKSMMSVKNF